MKAKKAYAGKGRINCPLQLTPAEADTLHTIQGWMHTDPKRPPIRGRQSIVRYALRLALANPPQHVERG